MPSGTQHLHQANQLEPIDPPISTYIFTMIIYYYYSARQLKNYIVQVE